MCGKTGDSSTAPSAMHSGPVLCTPDFQGGGGRWVCSGSLIRQSYSTVTCCILAYTRMDTPYAMCGEARPRVSGCGPMDRPPKVPPHSPSSSPLYVCSQRLVRRLYSTKPNNTRDNTQIIRVIQYIIRIIQIHSRSLAYYVTLPGTGTHSTCLSGPTTR